MECDTALLGCVGGHALGRQGCNLLQVVLVGFDRRSLSLFQSLHLLNMLLWPDSVRQ